MGRFDEILYAFGERLLNPLLAVSDSDKAAICEVHIRSDCPVAVNIGANIRYLCFDGSLSSVIGAGTVVAKHSDVEEVFSRLCERSFYSHESSVSNGYVVMRNGCRAGICGSFSVGEKNMRMVSSINIRIAKQISGCENELIKLTAGSVKSVLVAGPPGSGKTTILRELVRRYSNMPHSIALIDEKGEIAAVSDGVAAFKVGACTDIISGRCKHEAAEIALRMMNPEIIAYDEIADDADIMKSCASAGVRLFTTIHAESIGDVLKRLKKLKIDADEFDIIVVLSRTQTGKITDCIMRGDEKLCLSS